MNNFKFTKTIVGISPDLAKETVLSKIVSMVDVFMVNLSDWFDDNNKKFLDTVMKLDHSKSMMLETRWFEIRVRNMSNFDVKKGETIEIEFSEYTQENDKKIFINYKWIEKLEKWDKINFLQSDLSCTVIEINGDCMKCKIDKSWILYSYDRVNLPIRIEQEAFGQKDQKTLLWALEHNIHMIALSDISTHIDIISAKSFLADNNKPEMKVFAKIQNDTAIDNIDNILEHADWLILVINEIESYITDRWENIEMFVKKIRSYGKPVIISYTTNISSRNYELNNPKNIESFCNVGIDWVLLESIIHEDIIYDIVESINKNIVKYQNKSDISIEDFEEWDPDQIVRDYIIYNAYRTTKELDVKAIVCFTDSGYTPAKLVSMWPKVPIITFTKKEDTYRYLNTIWWVKWYKISPSFNYENLKKIGKEMIRIVFKWNISLEDKVVIVQANESIKEKTDMINWLELYRFKNI